MVNLRRAKPKTHFISISCATRTATAACSCCPLDRTPHITVDATRIRFRRAFICRAYYDRGAIFEQALDEYAPQLQLSHTETLDPAIRDRYLVREEQRNRFRTQTRENFGFAASVVQINPESALAMLQETPGSEGEATLQFRLLEEGLLCLANLEVEEIEVDGVLFRAFVAEAVYSWAVAAKGADSLLSRKSG